MKKFTRCFLVLFFTCTVLAGFVSTSSAQDAQLITPITLPADGSSANTGAYNQVTWNHNGATTSSSSYSNCSGYTTGNTLRVGSNTVYFQAATPNSTINQVQVKIQANSTTAANAIVAFSADASTWTNFSELPLLANNANPSCASYTVTAPAGAKYIRFMRVGFSGYTPTGTVGQTIRFFEVKVYVNLTCSNPTITTQPSTATQNVCQNSTATALTVVTSASSPTYQWYSSNDAVNNTSGDDVTVGTNADTYTPSTTTVGTKYYYCKISVSGGCSTTSNVSGAINTLALPAITGQNTPAAQYGENFGSPNPLTVTATGAGLSYQWYSSTDAATNTTGDDLPVGTNSNSFTPPTTPQGILYYYCVVSGTCTPSVTSAVSGAIEIVPACTTPTFSVQPTDLQTECQGGTLTLGTVAADQSPTYQWYSNATKTNTGGTSVGSSNGGSSATYTPPSGTAGTFYYYCVATNAACPTASNAVEITIYPTNPFVSQNTPGATYAISASASALTVTANGTSLSYQWYSSDDAANNTTGDDVTVGTNSNSYTPSTAAAGTKYYYCVITANCGTGTSAVSGAIVVVPYAVGDFGSLGTANWGTTNANWRQWNGSAWATVPAGAPTATDNVFILAGHTVTVEVSAKNCKNLTVEGTLKSSTLVNSPNYVRINGTTVTVNTGGFIGDAANPTGDNSNGIGLDLFGTNITINGTGGSIYVTRMKTNTSGTTVTVDHDMTINYHGSTNQGGHTAGFYPNSATVDNTTLTINSGKTLTFAPWSTLATTSSSNGIPAVNMTVNVNGTLTLQDSPAPNGGAVGAVNSFIYGGVAAGKTFTLNIGNGGVVNTPQICPNGTVSGGGVGTGTDAVITVTGTGQLNISKTADFRKASQTVTGTGSFNLLSGATLRIGSADGITASAASGNVQTTTRSFSSGASYSYEGTVAQATGDGLPSTVSGLTFNNASGVTLSSSATASSTLALSGGIITTGANTLGLSATGASLTGGSASAYVNGNLQRAVDNGASTVTFPVGDATGYAPASFNFGAGNTSGNLTASTTKPGTPAALASGLSQTKYIDRSWTLSSTIGAPDYDVTFTYLDPADVVGGANTSALIVAKNNGGTWSNPGTASSVSPSVSTVAGQTSFSTFYLGEAAASCINVGLTSAAANASPICSNATTTLTASGLSGTNAVVNWYTGSGGTGTNVGTGLTSGAVSPGTYYAYATGDCGSPVEIQVVVGAKTDVGLTSAAANASPICSSATTTLAASGLSGDGAVLNWYTGTGGTGSNVGTGLTSGPVGPGTYYAYATGDCGSPVEIQVTVGAKTDVGITNVTAAPLPGPLCSGQTTNLTANGVVGTNAVVTWWTGPNGTGANVGTGPTLNGVGANTYYARVTGDCGTPAEASITINSTGNIFTGTGNWSDNARWSCGAPPSSGDAVTIAAGANATLDVNFTVSGSLTMTPTSTLIVNPTRTLSVDVAATANFNGQSVTFQSDASGTASLGQVNGTLSGATNVTVERYIPNNGFRSWRLLSVPVTTSQTIRQAWQEGDVNPLPKDNNLPNRGTQITGVFTTQAAAAAAGFDSTSVQAGMLRWNGAAWSNITSTNQSINNFSSYFLYIRGERSQTVTGSVNSSSATTLRTKGTVYTGDQTTNVGAGAFALVPNLYPSAINFTGLTRTGGVNNLFYIWDSKKMQGSSLGVYQTFSATNSFNCLISGGSYTLGQPNTTIESGQSFFVTSGAAGTIVLKESAKVSGTNGSLGFRPVPSANRSKLEVRLYNGNAEMLDAGTVVFDAVYSKAVADEDAPKLGNPGANFAIETGSKLLAIEGTQPVKENDVIRYRMWNLSAGSYQLEFAGTNLSLPAGTEAVLEDSYLNTRTVLSTTAATAVNFTVDGNAGSSAASRFRVVIAKAATINNKAGFTIMPNPIEGSTMNVVFTQQAAGKYHIRIVSAAGQTAAAYRLTHAGGSANQSVSLPAVMGNGTYTVEIVSPDKSRTVKTVLVNRK